MSYFECYILLLLLLLIASFFEIGVLNTGKKRGVFFFLYVISTILILSFTLSIEWKSGDYIPYELFMDSLGTSYARYDFERGFVALCNLLYVGGIKQSHDLILLTAVIPVFVYLCYIRKSVYSLLALAIYLAHFHWWIGVVLIRQMWAFIFLTIAFYNYLSAKKYQLLWFYLWCCVAFMFHNSSVIFFLFPIIEKMRIGKRTGFIMVLIAFAIGQSTIVNSIISLIISGNIERADNYGKYLENANKGLNPLLYIEMLLMFFMLRMLHFRKTWNGLHCMKLSSKVVLNSSQILEFAYTLSLFTMCVAGVLYKNELASRMSMYGNFYLYLFVLPFILNNLSQKRRILCFAMLSCYLMIYMVRFLVFNCPQLM